MTDLEPHRASPFAFSIRILSSLKIPSYRLYLVVTIAHFAAMSMQMFTNPLLIYRLTGSMALLGMMSLVSSAPMIIVSIFGGAIADRISKKKIIVTSLICFAIVSTLIGLSLSYGILNKENPGSWWILFVSSAIQGCIMGIMMPALQAIIPEIVDRDQLMNAIALNSMGMNVLQLLSPAIAGPIIDRFNFHAVYYTMTGLYIVAAIIILFITVRKQIIAGGSKILGDIQQGFQYIRKDSLIVLVLFFTLIVTILSMPYQQLLPVYYDILKISATGGGILMSVSGIGALVASLVLTTLPNKKRGIILIASGILSGIALVIFSFSSHLYLSLVVIFFIGLAQAFRMTIGSALLQAYTEGAYMGRVMSILNMQWGFMSLCTFLAGVIADRGVDVQWVLGSLAILLIIISLAFLFFSPSIRKVE